MKIIQLQAENIKALTAVEINPDGNMVVISGENGAGKSSVLDSIYWALGGVKNIQDKPIRDGEESARIRLDLGEIIVTRKFTASGTQLVVTNADGAKFPSPQKMLDELVGAITFDPLEFSRMPAKEQVKVLREVAKVDVDFDEVDAANKADYDRRTEFNRDAKKLQATIDSLLPEIEGFQSKNGLIDMAEKLDQLQKEEAKVAELEKLQAELARATEEVVACGDTINDLQEQLDNAKSRYEYLAQVAKESQVKCNAFSAPTPEQLQKMRDFVKKIEGHNEKFRTKERVEVLQGDLLDMQVESDKCTKAINERNQQATEAIAAASLPVEGLSLTSDGITYNGIPFDQINSAQKLKISVAVAIASNPQLRVIRVENGSLLDAGGMKLLEELANQGDCQVWVERVGAEEMSVVISDGMVVN